MAYFIAISQNFLEELNEISRTLLPQKTAIYAPDLVSL
jgi:hypothetical protein